MKKFISGVLIITLFSVLYVSQQARLLEYSYFINSHQRYISLLVDQNRELRYNIARLENPARLEENMSPRQEEVQMPSAWHKIEIERELPAAGGEVITPNRSFIKVGELILSMFLLDSEAVAKELR
jgi:hypothetical protein